MPEKRDAAVPEVPEQGGADRSSSRPAQGSALGGGKGHVHRVPLRAKIYLFAALVTLSSVATSALFMYRAQRRQVETVLANLILNIARTGALFIDGDAHDHIVGYLQADKAGYKAIHSLLRQIQQENNLDPTAIYTCRKLNETTMEYVVALDRPRVGEYYAPAPQPLATIQALYQDGKARFTRRYDTGEGSFISAVAAVKDKQGEVVGYLEIDAPESLLAATMTDRLVPLALALVIGAAMALLIAVLLTFTITSPLGEVLALTNEVVQGKGDLTRRIRVDSRDILGELAAAINSFIEHLQLIIRRVLEAAHLAEKGSRRLGEAAVEQVKAAEEQSSAVAEATATIGELIRTFRETAHRTSIMAEEAVGASATADEGMEQLEEAVRGMEVVKETAVETIQEIYGLLERSQDIGKVMNLIHDVATRTKIIAFNASIEASAAGGQTGARFAVVAQEVRKLATGVVESTADIEGIIREIQQRVQKLILTTEGSYRKIEGGFQAAGNAKSAIEKIQEAVRRTADSAMDIGNTTTMQTAASDQALISLRSIQETTDTIRRAVARMKETVDALDEMHRRLLDEIGHFHVGEEEDLDSTETGVNSGS